MPSCALSADVTEPRDETVIAGGKAYFVCVTTGNFANWRLDGMNLDDLPPGELRDEAVADEITGQWTGNRHFTLTIPGRAAYNGTTVQCVSDDGKKSNVATLFVKGIINYHTMFLRRFFCVYIFTVHYSYLAMCIYRGTDIG